MFPTTAGPGGLYESLHGSINQGFSSEAPGTYCWPCFRHGLWEGFRDNIGKAFLVGVGIGLLTAVLGPEFAIALAIVGTAALLHSAYQLYTNRHNMSEEDMGRAIGGMTAGILGGGAGGAVGGALATEMSAAASTLSGAAEPEFAFTMGRGSGRGVPAEAGEGAGAEGSSGIAGRGGSASGNKPSPIDEAPQSREIKGPYSHLEDPPNVGPEEDFTPAQRQRIIEENKARNGGVVKSDKSGTVLVKPKKSQKGVTPPQDEWQIDHIVPKDKGGTNSYSNAQVLSRQENRAKSNK